MGADSRYAAAGPGNAYCNPSGESRGAENGGPPGGASTDEGWDIDDLEGTFAKRLSDMDRSTITDRAWQYALRSYRQRLLDGLELGRWEVSLVGKPSIWPVAFSENMKTKQFRNDGFQIRRPGQREGDLIRLASLFSDCVDSDQKRFKPKSLQTLLDFLKKVSRGGGARFASMQISEMIRAARSTSKTIQP